MSIAFHLPGNIPVYTFSLLLGLAATVGLGWVVVRSEADRVSVHVSACLWSLLGALLGSRAGYLAVNWGYYQDHTNEILQVPLGGLAWPGAVAGGLVGLIFAAALARRSLLKLADILFPMVGVLVIATWLGCWMDGCAYGQLSDAWYRLPSKDEWGRLQDRVPLQFIGAVLSLATLWSLDMFRARGRLVRPGQEASLGWFALGLQGILLIPLRADPAPLWSGYRLDFWVAAALAGIAFLAFLTSFVMGGDQSE